MLTVATDYFGLSQDNQLKVVIDDGVEFLKKAVKNGLFKDSESLKGIPNKKSKFTISGRSFKAVLFDVDSKDPTVGMSCPPVQFVEQEVLDTVKACIRDNGIFILNLVCRDEKLRDQVLVDLKNTFKTVVSYKLDEDVNEILYCQNTEYDAKSWTDAMEKSVKYINDLMKKEQHSSDGIELQEFMQQLQV